MNAKHLPILALLLSTALTGCDERADTHLGPGTIGDGRSSTDRTAPAVVSTNPVNQSTQVIPTAPIAVTFTEPVRRESLEDPVITLDPPVAGRVTFVGNTVVFTPLVSLVPTTNYRATISTDAEDLAGNNLAAPFSWTFITGTPPLLDRR